MEPSCSDIEDQDSNKMDGFIFMPIDCTLVKLLKEWDMELLLPKLISSNINMSNLKYLTEIEISSIFKNDLGNQARFRANFIEWKKKNNLPHCETLNDGFESKSSTNSSQLVLQQFSAETERMHSSTPCQSPSSSPTTSPLFFDLTTFFETTTGSSIKRIYDANKPPQFTPDLRETFCTYIARYYVERNKCMTLTDFRNVTSQIVEYFPEENPEYYFKTSRNPSGKLYNKYRVISKNLKKVGYFTDIKRRRTQTPDHTQDSDTEFTDIDEKCDNKDWLKVHKTPWEIIEQKWTTTFDVRSRELSRTKNTTSFISEWPLYRHTKGYRLIELDFECIYPNNHGQLFKSWDNFKSNIGEIFKKQLKDKSAIEIFKKISTNEDIQHIQLCKLLHYILKPSGKLNQDKQIWKFTINDSIQSFIIEVENPSQVTEKIENAKEFCISKNLKLQPFIIYINSNVPQFCVVYDNIYYSFNNFLVALDICFKIFFVFKLTYPKQSEKFWLFIQKKLYDITTKYDNLTPDLIDIISQIDKKK